MPSPTDEVLAGDITEIEERQAFIDGLLVSKKEKGEDLDADSLEMITRARDRIGKLDEQMRPIEDAKRMLEDSRDRVAAVSRMLAGRDKRPTKVEYRSAGEYAVDMWRGGLGNTDARERLELYNRAAAHQTTPDNPGLLPEPILGPVINFIDAARPVVSVLGARQLPAGSWSRPKVTQSTQVAEQPTGEKNELVSRKMLIGKVDVTARTYGGYVNVSRQNLDWSQPAIMDIVINDLAAQYAIETENALVDNLTSGATTGPTLATGALTAAAVSAAFWTAAASVFTAVKGQGRVFAVCGPDMLGQYGPLFVPVNPQNAISTGFSAGDFSTGLAGNISGIPVYVTPGMALLTTLIMSTAAAEAYEDRIGALQVVEPSVLGVQVAYAGYFADVVLQATGIQKIVKTA